MDENSKKVQKSKNLDFDQYSFVRKTLILNNFKAKIQTFLDINLSEIEFMDKNHIFQNSVSSWCMNIEEEGMKGASESLVISATKIDYIMTRSKFFSPPLSPSRNAWWLWWYFFFQNPRAWKSSLSYVVILGTKLSHSWCHFLMKNLLRKKTLKFTIFRGPKDRGNWLFDSTSVYLIS